MENCKKGGVKKRRAKKNNNEIFFSVGNGESNWIVGAVTDDLGRTTVLARIGNDSLRLTLALPSVSPEDSGQYLCSPSNMAPVSASLHVVIGNCMVPLIFFFLPFTFCFYSPPLFFISFPNFVSPFLFSFPRFPSVFYSPTPLLCCLIFSPHFFHLCH
jgi:hypothetical protein